MLPPLSVGEMTLRLYAALNYSHNSARDLRRALLFGLVASGQIRLRRIDGYQHLADVLAQGEVAA